MNLADIPSETIEAILIHCSPYDLSAFARTSRAYRAIVYEGDQHLWRSVFPDCKVDDPRNCVDHLDRPILTSDVEFDWRGEVQRILRVRGVARDPARRARAQEAHAILRTLLDISERYARLDLISSTAGEFSLNTKFLLRCLPPILEYNGWGLSDTEMEMRARLHTLYGLTRSDRRPESRRDSRAFVYDLRRYSVHNDFGPFIPDGSGRVNWTHMRAIQHVMAMHVDQGAGAVSSDLSAFACQPLDHAPQYGGNGVQDWAGVDGMWNVAFACCDQRALMAFNTAHNPAIFSHPHFAEIFSSVPFRLEVREYERDPLHPDHPKIHFRGVTQHNTSVLEGHISLSADELVRWHWVGTSYHFIFVIRTSAADLRLEQLSGDNGDRRWSTEGVHVGHVRGGFGMLGTWTSMFNAAHDFIGLTWITRVRSPGP